MQKKRTGLEKIGVAVAGVALLAVALALLDLLGRDYLADALGPIATLYDHHAGDAASDASAADDNGAEFLPVPPLLDDERVVEAIGPLAKLSCNRDDPGETDGPAVDAASRGDALDAPLASYENDAQPRSQQPLLAAAVAPLASLSAPHANSAAANDVDARADCPALLQHRFNRLQTGESQSLCQFRGKVLLIVNTSSYCAYTGQY